MSISDAVKLNISGRLIASFCHFSISATNYGTSLTTATNAFGIGAFGVAHWNLKNLGSGSAVLDRLDFFLGLGLGASIVSASNEYKSETTPSAEFGYTSGLTYYVNDRLGVSFDYNDLIGSTLSATYKF